MMQADGEIVFQGWRHEKKSGGGVGGWFRTLPSRLGLENTGK